MAKKEMSSYLRLEIMNLDEFTCQICYADHLTLNVHHLIYFPGRNPWEYEDKHLITLCEGCHASQKGIKVQEIFADLSINNSTAIYVGFMLSKLIPETVSRSRATEQAVWSILFDRFRDEFAAGTIQKELSEYKAKYNG